MYVCCYHYCQPRSNMLTIPQFEIGGIFRTQWVYQYNSGVVFWKSQNQWRNFGCVTSKSNNSENFSDISSIVHCSHHTISLSEPNFQIIFYQVHTFHMHMWINWTWIMKEFSFKTKYPEVYCAFIQILKSTEHTTDQY